VGILCVHEASWSLLVKNTNLVVYVCTQITSPFGAGATAVANWWSCLSATSTYHCSATADFQVHLELPLNSFQPALCHPIVWDLLKNLSDHLRAAIATNAAKEDAGSDPRADVKFGTIDSIQHWRGYPVQGYTAVATEDGFFVTGHAYTDSNRMYCFWAYNAIFCSDSVSDAALRSSTLRWSGLKLKIAIDKMADIWETFEKTKIPDCDVVSRFRRECRGFRFGHTTGTRQAS